MRKVAELENEVQRQIELRAAYSMRMERTQDYLRYCLRIAQENGFLELLINKNNGDDQLPSPMSSELITTPVPTPVHPLFHLAALIDRAKANGWYIEPHEVGNSLTALMHKYYYVYVNSDMHSIIYIYMDA